MSTNLPINVTQTAPNGQPDAPDAPSVITRRCFLTGLAALPLAAASVATADAPEFDQREVEFITAPSTGPQEIRDTEIVVITMERILAKYRARLAWLRTAAEE